MLNGAIAAAGRVGLMMNVPKRALPRVLEVLPALGTPTISALADEQWIAVNTVVAGAGRARAAADAGRARRARHRRVPAREDRWLSRARAAAPGPVRLARHRELGPREPRRPTHGALVQGVVLGRGRRTARAAARAARLGAAGWQGGARRGRGERARARDPRGDGPRGGAARAGGRVPAQRLRGAPRARLPLPGGGRRARAERRHARPSRGSIRTRCPTALFPWFRGPLLDALGSGPFPLERDERLGPAAIAAGLRIDLRSRWRGGRA